MPTTIASLPDPLAASAAHSPGAQASVVVAVVIFSSRPDAAGRPGLQVLLVRRAVEPFAGSWSLPGGKLWGDEALDQAAWRQLLEKTALRASYLEQLYTFELCDAAQQIESVVVAYYALVRTDGTEIAPGRKTMEAAWFPVDELPAELAFDNDEILHYALQQLRNKVEYALVAFQFLPPLFTMAQLRAVYEVILDAGSKQRVPHTMKVEVEITSIDQIDAALDGGADIILLDNMSNQAMRDAVRRIGSRALTERAGNVTLETIRERAETGVDLISSGALTHSAKALDISLEIEID